MATTVGEGRAAFARRRPVARGSTRCARHRVTLEFRKKKPAAASYQFPRERELMRATSYGPVGLDLKSSSSAGWLSSISRLPAGVLRSLRTGRQANRCR